MNEIDALKQHIRVLNGMDRERQNWFPHWREVASMFFPRRFDSLLGGAEIRSRAPMRNTELLDSTSIKALNILASGMMNGVTSPSRKWLNLTSRTMKDSQALSAYYAQCEEVMLKALSNSNFYNSMANLFLEWAGFGTACLFIREDYEDIFRCYLSPIGEYYLSVDATGRVNRVGRRFSLSFEAALEEFGIDAFPKELQDRARDKQRLLEPIAINYILERNDPKDGLLSVPAEAREVYWLIGTTGEKHKYLAIRPMREWPAITPRWMVHGSSSYGTAPTMEAYPDVVELQALSLRMAQGVDKMISPPLIVDAQLRHRPKALGAGGVTYASNVNANFGAKPAYQVQIPVLELHTLLQDLRDRVRSALHNDLFNMISQLETVRSATEIDARREEKLIHLGPVLERFYEEGLVPAIRRIYGIMRRAGMFPEPPEEVDPADLEVHFESILSNAQMSADVTAIERFFSFTGQLAAVYPEVQRIPNTTSLLRKYAKGLGIRPDQLASDEELAAAAEEESARAALAETAAIGGEFAKGAQVLSQTDVGGGMNALQEVMGGL